MASKDSKPAKSTETVENPDELRKRANSLTGREWTRYSISVWRDIKRNAEERALGHPAMFPSALVERLIQIFTRPDERIVLDPFSGSGSTLMSTRRLGGQGIGFELSEEYLTLTQQRLNQADMFADGPEPSLHAMDARQLTEKVLRDSVDLAITSPPYWDILNRKRTADYKEMRNYGNYENDLGTISDYDEFLSELAKVWSGVHEVLKPGCYFIINVMDLRKGPKFIPFHIDVTNSATSVGFELDDIIIWDRSADYNNLRALGYPYVFRINKVHEFLLIFRKPAVS